MRTRVLLVVAVVFTALLATIGGVTAQSGATSELEKFINAVRQAEVTGDVVTVNAPKTENPFGGVSQLSEAMNDSISITHSSHFVVNPASQPYQHFNPPGQDIVISWENEEGIVDTSQIMPVFDQMWTPPLQPGGASTPEAFFDQFLGELPGDFGPQFGQGQPFPVNGATVVPPAGGSLPDFNQPFEVRVQRVMNPFGPGWCSGSIFEFFTGDAMPGDPTWVPADFAPNDSFADLSQAHVTRCVDGQIQPTQLLVNNGSNFQPQATHAMAIFMENTFIQIIPFSEVMGSEGCRQGAFVTDAANPFQPDNSGFVTAPPYPELNPMLTDTTFINNPWPGANLNPLGLTFGPGSEGGSGFQDNFGLMIDTKDESGETNEYSALTIQLGTYQIMEGILTYDSLDKTYAGTLEGSGDGYMESITFGPNGISYTHDTGTPEVYEVTMEPGNDSALISEMAATTAVREVAANPTTTTSQPAPTTITSPGDDPAAEGGGESTDEGSSSPLLLILLFLVFLAIIAGLFWWFFIGAKKKDPCKELYDAWMAAKKACVDAKAKAKKARADADKAKTDREKAEQDRKDHCKAFPPACGPQASITDVGSGRTLNRDDLFVQRAWGADAWAGYKAKSKTAQEVQDQWGQPPSDEFRDTKLKELDAAKKKTPELDKAITDAKAAEQKANDDADAAEKAADKACADADAAKKAYDDCVGKAKAADAAGDQAAAAAAGAAVGGAAGAAAGAAIAQGAGQQPGGGCDPQQKAYDAAKAECDTAKAASDKAAKESADADKAQADAEQAMEDLCAEYPPLCDKESWIEESGKPETRITNTDLHVRDMWAEQVWVDYQTDQISAQECSDRWSQDPPPEFAADELQKLKDAKPLKDARDQAVKDTKAKADAARKAAKDTKAKADEACAKADAAKKVLDACLAATGAK